MSSIWVVGSFVVVVQGVPDLSVELGLGTHGAVMAHLMQRNAGESVHLRGRKFVECITLDVIEGGAGVRWVAKVYLFAVVKIVGVRVCQGVADAAVGLARARVKVCTSLVSTGISGILGENIAC